MQAVSYENVSSTDESKPRRSLATEGATGRATAFLLLEIQLEDT